MKLRTALPAFLTNKMCERFDPSRMGGAPAIRFVPNSSASGKKENGEEPDQVKRNGGMVAYMRPFFLHARPAIILEVMTYALIWTSIYQNVGNCPTSKCS